MIQFVIMIVVGVIIFIYGLNLLNNLKDNDEYKDSKRFGYAIAITVGVILVSMGMYQIVLYTRLNPIRRTPTLELPSLGNSIFSSPRNQRANI